MPAKYKSTGKPVGRPRQVDGPVIQPRIMQADYDKLLELSELEEFKNNQAEVVRIALRELHKSRFKVSPASTEPETRSSKRTEKENNVSREQAKQ